MAGSLIKENKYIIYRLWREHPSLINEQIMKMVVPFQFRLNVQ